MVNKMNGLISSFEEGKLLVKQAEKKNSSEEKVKKAEVSDQAYIYEKTAKTETSKKPYKINRMSEKERAALVEQMKKDTEARKAQLISLVNQTLSGQGKALSLATENKDDIWKILAKGNFTVDAATKKQAQEDISEKGYWGIEKTAQRLFDFASALAGDDTEKMKQMKDAMLKGFKEATKAWGRDLPEISKKTLDAANKLFDDYFKANKKEAMTFQVTDQTKSQATVHGASKV